MTIVEFLLLLLVAAICGSLAQALSGYSRGGCLVTIVLGFIGALLGTWLARATGLPEVLAIDVGGQRFPIIWSVIGGAIFCAVLALLTRRPAVLD
ncbi:MAG: GlsB/YeaQ/YmgE family stress response membrane protein [Planctomycetia bacterium]|nr:GlsB/YeaQ/YmgE family stress response membrane protein [Planctomycetia bacterium]